MYTLCILITLAYYKCKTTKLSTLPLLAFLALSLLLTVKNTVFVLKLLDVLKATSFAKLYALYV